MIIMTNRQNKCFISLAIKALGIKKKFELYTSEKEHAKAGKFSEVNNQNSLGNKFSESFNTTRQPPKITKPGFFKKLRVEDSVENFVLKSILGFIGGIFLTYVCFMFLVFSLNFTLKRATYICMGLGVILSLGLAFSVKIRCTVFLCIPQLFSKRGRQALLAYAFILALSGPAKNTLHNVEVMSESLACTQEQLKQAENELLKCVQKPNAAAKKSIEKLLEKINSAVKDFKNFILQLYKNCFDILETVLQAQKWLYSITFLCHKKMGHPAHGCLKLLAESSQNCESMYSITTWKKLCQIKPQWQKMICNAEERSVCPNVAESLPVLKLQKQLDAFKRRALNVLYVKIEAQQTYCQANRSHTYHEEYQGMATEIRQKTDQFLQYFDFMSVIFGIFILVLFVKVVIYRHKFLTEDHYDNRYITSDFIDIDNTRAAFHMETILPLEPREKMQYIKVTSVRLVPCERVRLFSSFVFLIFATFKIIIHMLTDSSLYWILSSVRGDERLLYMSTITDEQPLVAVRVVGYGMVASLFENVTRVVRKELSFVRMDPTPCLPDPVPPDWNRYYQILALVIICWLLALWEPYGLRLRHTVMVTYHPDRARERAIWLYNRIISNRISYVKKARRMLRRKYRDDCQKETFRYKLLGPDTPKCLVCESTTDLEKCSNPDCPGIYCACCLSVLKFCSICRNPAEYDDLSDISEEKDSSEDESRVRSPCRGESGRVRRKSQDDSGEERRWKCPEKKEAITLFARTLTYCKGKIANYGSSKRPTSESSEWDRESFMSEGCSSDDRLLPPEDWEDWSYETVGWFSKIDSAEKELRCPRSLSSGRLPACPPATPHLPSGDDSKPDLNFKRHAKESKVAAKCGKCDVGVLARVKSKELQKPQSPGDCSLPEIPPANRLEVTTTSRRCPFVDPVNLHEFFAEADGRPPPGDKPQEKKKGSAMKKFFSFKRKKKPSKWEPGKGGSGDKIYFMEPETPEKDPFSGSESDGQFYSEQCNSSEGHFPLQRSDVFKRQEVSRSPDVDSDKSDRLKRDSSCENLTEKASERLETRGEQRREAAAPDLRDSEMSELELASWDCFCLPSEKLGDLENGGPGTNVRSMDTEHELNIIVLGTVDSISSHSDCN